MPLFFVFWVADLIYVPSLKWEFLAIRTCILPSSLLCHFLIRRSRTLPQTELSCSVITIANAFPIVAMIWMIGDFKSPYYAGLLMVAAGIGNFFPWTRAYFVLQNVLIFGPYFAVFLIIGEAKDLGSLILHSFFIVGMVVITSVIWFFSERLTRREFSQRIARERELKSRDRTIRRKTSQGLRLERLSRQFSPQVVNRIKEGLLDVDKSPELAEICAVVVDISGYTNGCRRLPPGDIQIILNRFYRSCVQRFFKYDITFDKTMGDAVLGFSNEPVQYRDYVQRVAQAAIEIQDDIKRNRSELEQLWRGTFSVKIAIATGPAKVGFFGDADSPKVYTASGEVMNLVARLCDCAAPGQIVCTSNVADSLTKYGGTNWDIFSLTEQTTVRVQGYEDAPQRMFLVEEQAASRFKAVDCPTCPQGHGQLHLDENEKGLFVFACRVCGYCDEGGNEQGTKVAA